MSHGPSPHDLAREFRHAIRPLVRQFNAAKSLSLGKAGILIQIDLLGRATASEIATAERISPQAVMIAVRELEALGLVSRSVDDIDRRKLWIELTATGRDSVLELQRAGNAWLEGAILERLNEAEIAVLAKAIPVLAKLTTGPADG